MKTSGFREIDFSKTECTNFACGNKLGYFLPKELKRGEIVTPTWKQSKSFFVGEGYYTLSTDNCPVCKGMGFIDESVTAELELEGSENK